MKNVYFFCIILLSFLAQAQVAPACFNSLISANVFSVGTMPMESCVADLNNDGKPDIITANASSGNISILLGIGSGSFTTPTNISPNLNPWSVCSADFNGDGHADIASCDPGNSKFSISINSGSGSFSSTLYNSGTSAYTIRTADFNHDGNPDLAVTYNSGVSVYMGNSAGTFTTAVVNYATATGGRCVHIKDLNGDGEPDLAVTNMSSGSVSVLLGSSTGTFAAAVSYSVGSSPNTVSSGDFNNDGNFDLVVCNAGSQNISLLLGSTSGTFATSTTITSGATPASIDVADFNGDGNMDLAVANNTVRAVSLVLGNGAGVFSAPVPYQILGYSTGVTASDLNGDWSPDVISLSSSGNKVSCLLNNGMGNLAAPIGNITGNGPISVGSADFNGDGKLDLVSPNYASNNISVFLALSANSFSAGVTYSVGTNPNSLATADFNNDGKQDIAVSNYNSANFALLLGSTTGTFGVPSYFATDTHPYSLISADFNLDGNQDVAISSLNLAAVAVYFGDGAGNFASPLSYLNPASGSALTAADFNGDGNMDIAAVSSGYGYVGLLLGSSSGTFSAGSTTFATGSFPYSISTADFNGDSKSDLVVGNYSSNNVSVLIGTGTGSFAPQTTYSVGNTPYGVCTGDFNMDGFPDIAAANALSDNISVLLNNGSGTFGTQTQFPSGSYPRAIISKDFNYDAKPDLVIAALGENSINILLNGSPTVSLSTTSTVCLGNSIVVTAYGANSYTWSNNATGHTVTLTPTASSVFSVLAKSFGGCAGTAAKSITVNAYPIPTVAVSSGSICSGQSFSLNPSGASVYSITGGQSVVTPTATKSYTVVGTNTLTGCYSAPVVAGVTVAVTPTVTVNSSTICEGKSFTIVPNGAPNYTIQGGTNIVSPLVSASYSVIGSSTLGCLSNIAYANVPVFPAPVISVTSGSVCIGGSFSMQPSGAPIYYYVAGGPVVSPLASTDYSVYGVSNIGCLSIIPAISHVTVVPLPTVFISGNNFVCAGSPLSLIASGSAATYSWSNGMMGNLITVTPSVSGNYTVTGFISTCKSSITKSIMVLSLPTISISDGSVCLGKSYTLNPSGGISYTYSGGSPVVTPSVVSTYTIIGVDANGCKGSASTMVSILPLPNISVMGSTPFDICVGESVTITATGAVNYTWSTNEVANPITVTPLVSTVYTVTGSDQNGCTNSSVIAQNVSLCTGLNQLVGTTQQLTVYPNPNSGEFIVESEEVFSIRIVNTMGQLISESNVGEGKNKIDLTNYANGIYFIQFRKNSDLQTIKVIKN